MKLEDLRLTADSIDKLYQLAVKVELHSRYHYKLNKSLDDVIKLLKYAYASNDKVIKEILNAFIVTLSATTLNYFKELNLDFYPTKAALDKKLYRGQEVIDSSEESARKSVKKIIYRGKEVLSEASISSDKKSKITYRGQKQE